MNGWILGYIIGAVLVVVVATVLLLMIRGAARTARKAEDILGALHAARDGTAPLWQVDTTILTADRIVAAARAARLALEGGLGS